MEAAHGRGPWSLETQEGTIVSDASRRSRSGFDLLHNPLLNKGTAFTEHERRHLGLRGLLASRVATIEEQLTRTLENNDAEPNALERDIDLTALHDRNEGLFHRLLIDHLERTLLTVLGARSFARSFDP